jgi:hypothetical protein
MPGDVQSIQSGEIARSIKSFTQALAVGMVVVPSGVTTANRETIAAFAARHRLPAVYARTYFATSRGLVSYGSDTAIRLVVRPAMEYQHNHSHHHGRRAPRCGGSSAGDLRGPLGIPTQLCASPAIFYPRYRAPRAKLQPVANRTRDPE